MTLLLALFGLVCLWWSQGHNPRLRRWAPVVGLAGQPAWGFFALQTQRAGLDASGLWVLVGIYSCVYVRGIVVQWRGKPCT